MTRSSRLTHVGSPTAALMLPLLLTTAIASAALTATAATGAEPKPAAAARKASPGALDSPKAKASGLASIDLPHYEAPAAFSVDIVIKSPKANMVMKRFIDQGRIRTEMTGAGMDVVMIEMGDAKGTSLTLMPNEKRAIKQSREAMESMVGEKMKQRAKEAEAVDAAAPPPDVKVEDLGNETVDGKAVKKLRITVPEGASVGWFDTATGAPVRMEGTVDGETAVIEWKDYKVAPQPAKLFEAPKDYELTDMDEMMSKMKGMGGMGGMKGMKGGVGGVNRMMGGMGQNMGQSMGGSLGASLGGSLGGPLGAIAGRYLGGKVGGMIGKKTAEVVTPGK